MTEKLTREERRGRADHARKVARADNPYALGTDARVYWYRGWDWQSKKCEDEKSALKKSAVLTRGQIRDVLMAHGFRPKEGDDLRPYVYDAADALVCAVIERLRASNVVSATDPIAWHSKQYGTCWMHLQPYHLTEGAKLYIRGRSEPVATVRSGACIVWHMSTADLPHGTFLYPSPVSDLAQPQPYGNALPERDASKPVEAQGLFRKFDVRRTDGSDAPGGRHHGCRYFVLDMDHDAHAGAALTTYAASCEKTHPDLARDLREKWGARQSSGNAGGPETRIVQIACRIPGSSEPETSRLYAELRAALAAQPSGHGTDMVSVTKHDANAYCQILSILSMEEEGDAVAEVQRLLGARQPTVPGPSPTFDQWWAVVQCKAPYQHLHKEGAREIWEAAQDAARQTALKEQE